jgi:hypothetical protein
VLITSAFSHADHSVTFDEYFDNVTLCGRARTSILPPNWNVFSRAQPNEDRKTFVQAYGSPSLDAALLMMPLVGFLAATDERMRGTVEASGAS